MIDREKVLKGLRCCRDIHLGATLDDSCNQCPFQQTRGETCDAHEMFYSAIALLKKQEEQIKKFELEKTWDEHPDTMGKW